MNSGLAADSGADLLVDLHPGRPAVWSADEPDSGARPAAGRIPSPLPLQVALVSSSIGVWHARPYSATSCEVQR
jgi:hypothetical protein